MTARSAADILGIHPNSAVLFYRKIRMVISHRLTLAADEVFDGSVKSQPLCGQALLDDVLGGDARVVRSRKPEDAESLHPPGAAENILERVVEGMPHVKGPRDVGRGDDDRERRTGGIDLSSRIGRASCRERV